MQICSLENKPALISLFIKDIPRMPEKRGKARMEADFISCVCLGVDAFKISFSAIRLLLLLFPKSHGDFSAVWEAEVPAGRQSSTRRRRIIHPALPGYIG